MPVDWSKLNFLTYLGKLTARSRILVVFLTVISLVVLFYLAVEFLTAGEGGVGPTQIAGAPAGVTSVPGGTLLPEYQRTLTEQQRREAAARRMTGETFLPTQMGVPSAPGSCVICSDQSANVKNFLDDWRRQGKVPPEVADSLQSLANKNVTAEEYGDNLKKLVLNAQLTPEQARQLFDEYKKQHTNANLAEGTKVLDDFIKSCQVPLDVANQLLDAQKKGMSVPDYADMLQKMVNDGKISPATAQQLLQQYSGQCSKEATAKHISFINKIQQDGAMSAEVAKSLSDIATRYAPTSEYSSAIDAFVKQNKLTPDVATKLLNAYRGARSACAPPSVLDKLLQEAENAAYSEVSNLLATGQISPETAAQLTGMIQSNVPLDQFRNAIGQMVTENKLTPEIGQLKLNDYTRIKQLRDAEQALADLKARNVTPEEYADALRKLVADGVITPQQAAQLMQEYQTALTPQAPVVPVAPGAFGELQQRVAAGAPAVLPPVTAAEFAAAPKPAAEVAAVAEETREERQARLSTLINAMTNQATQLISTWQPPTMKHVAGEKETIKRKEELDKDKAVVAAGTKTTTTTTAVKEGPVLIKAGTILFGVLDTAVNSDYPDSPVLVTIVTGKFKGAKLLGKIVTTKGVTGQMDRVSLNFTLMDEPSWPRTKSVTAYAIDPDTARTVMASSVNYHYLMRFGAIFATSFLQGYATAVTNEGTSTTGIFGTSTTTPSLSPANKIAVALGQVGQNIGTATQNWINRPPTVRVKSGVSLGILFMSDVA